MSSEDFSPDIRASPQYSGLNLQPLNDCFLKSLGNQHL